MKQDISSLSSAPLSIRYFNVTAQGFTIYYTNCCSLDYGQRSGSQNRCVNWRCYPNLKLLDVVINLTCVDRYDRWRDAGLDRAFPPRPVSVI